MGHAGPHSPPAPGLGRGAASLHLKKSNVEVITLKICSRMGFCVAPEPGSAVGMEHGTRVAFWYTCLQLGSVLCPTARDVLVLCTPSRRPRVPQPAVSPRLRPPPVPPQGRVSVWVPHKIGLRSFKCLN